MICEICKINKAECLATDYHGEIPRMIELCLPCLLITDLGKEKEEIKEPDNKYIN